MTVGSLCLWVLLLVHKALGISCPIQGERAESLMNKGCQASIQTQLGSRKELESFGTRWLTSSCPLPFLLSSLLLPSPFLLLFLSLSYPLSCPLFLLSSSLLSLHLSSLLPPPPSFLSSPLISTLLLSPFFGLLSPYPLFLMLRAEPKPPITLANTPLWSCIPGLYCFI